MPLQATSGAASYDAFGGGVPVEPNYIESVFSTFLYTGNGSTQTITNGIDLAGKGGLVWLKRRDSTSSHVLVDSQRGISKFLRTNSTDAESTSTTNITAFNADGFSLGTATNVNDGTYTSWTFREQPKFFDIVTYTGNGTAGRQIAHNLGSAPGCVIVKCTSDADGWVVQHRSLNTASGQTIQLNTTDAAYTANTIWNSTAATSTVFTVGTDGSVNGSGRTYVAYLFAHNAGGFGLSGTDNVISCGSFTGSGGIDTVTLGYEPQWILMKNSTGSSNWRLMDTMRGMSYTNLNFLDPNTSNAEGGFSIGFVKPTPTGFTVEPGFFGTGATVIYIAIRRGPMKVPTSGTSVFTPYLVPASPTTGAITGFVTDAGFIGQRAGADKFAWGARLMGNPTLNSTNTNAESANTNQIWDRMNGWWNTAINNYMTWGFARAPGFMDVVCYTGTGSARTQAHNLGVVPEMMIVKARATGSGGPYNWTVYHSALSAGGFAYLNLTNAGVFSGNTSFWNGTAPTASVFSLGGASGTNESGNTYVAYLFASCPGVSKVGSYTGTGTAQTINCGFTAGSRFVMIKRADDVGDWYVWDSARGIVAGNDPYLLLNSTAAEVTSTDFVDTAATGFELSSTAPAALNASGGSYIFLAIA